MKEWDGKTQGSLWGYKFFTFCVDTFGLSISYFICYFVSLHFMLFAVKQRKGLISFHKKAFQTNSFNSIMLASKTFFRFGQTLIDRIAMHTKHKIKFSYEFRNEQVLKKITSLQQGGILISGHVGNWEIAGNLIHDRVSSKINVVMLDNEVETIKNFIQSKTGDPRYNLIPIKNDFSHLILMKQALDRNELIAMHADRIMDKGKVIELSFLGSKAKFPLGPFILAQKFKVPVTFVYANKSNKYHYVLTASDPIINAESPESLAKAYVMSLEDKVRAYSDQWFNFYEYYVA